MNTQFTNSRYALNATQTASLMSRVSYLLSTCLLATAGAAYVARDWPIGTAWLFAIGGLICVVILGFTRKTTGLNLALLYALSVCEGLSLGPILNAYAHAYTHGGIIIAQAFTLTAVIMGGIGSYIWISNKDFGFLGKFLFWGLIGLVVVGFIGMFWQGLFGTAQSQLIYCVIGAAIFIGFTLYDFSNIRHRYGPDDYINATVQLYLDFLNLFMFLLRILAILSGNGGRSRD